MTVDLRKKKEPNVAPSDPPPLPADLPPEIVNFDHWLKQYRERLKGKGLYLPDDYPTPGFDCDDYADALARWLQRRFSGATIQVIHTFWERPPGSGKKVGHVLILIKQGGYYWILDPQTGILLGPFTDDTPIDVSPILDPGYGVPPGTPVKVKGPYDPGYRGKGEPKPWWYDPDMRRHFEEKTGHPWWWYVPDGAPLLVDEVADGGPDPEIEDPQPQFELLPV